MPNPNNPVLQLIASFAEGQSLARADQRVAETLLKVTQLGDTPEQVGAALLDGLGSTKEVLQFAKDLAARVDAMARVWAIAAELESRERAHKGGSQ